MKRDSEPTHSLMRLGRRIVSRVMRMSPVEEVDSEFDFHVEMRVRDNLGRGMSWKEARADAVERFGDLDRVKAVCRDIAERREAKKAWRDWIAGWTQDVRFAFRQIRKRPGFALLAILTLTIGIGANTAVFSVVNGVLLRPLPFTDAGRLVGLYNRYLPESGYDWPQFPLSLPEVLDYRDQTEAMASVGYHRWYTGDWCHLSVSTCGEQPVPARCPVLLREAWERVVEEVLLNGVVQRFGRTVLTMRLSKLLDLENSDILTVDAAMKKASTWLPGHDQSAALNVPMPEPDELEKDIAALETFRLAIEKRRK